MSNGKSCLLPRLPSEMGWPTVWGLNVCDKEGQECYNFNKITGKWDTGTTGINTFQNLNCVSIIKVIHFLESTSFDVNDILDWCDKFSDYLSFEELYDAIDEIAAKYSQVKVETIGHSFDERAIKVVKIQKITNDKLDNIYVQAGNHAREWIGIASVLYFIERMAKLVEVHIL